MSKLFINVMTITLPFVESEEMEDCLYHSIVRGHHVYKSVWTPYIGEVLPVQEELGNEHDSIVAKSHCFTVRLKILSVVSHQTLIISLHNCMGQG